ncbi:MAG: type II toxin-antitoxin system VapC family toxin [Thermincola sp.]|nr:type II toxin-antitoxin system VapC family toxin [Thermincola sp.]MDT3704679.1 type II toxin-antitoxin system VapC family toxin [Thermincola sp.]
MNRYLVDSNIIIYVTKGHENAFAFMEQLYADQSKDILCSVVTEAELFSIKLSDQTQEIIEGVLSEAEIIHITSEIARKAGEIRAKGHELGYKIKLPDALIAATAIVEKAIVVTHNVADFRRIGQLEEIIILDPME